MNDLVDVTFDHRSDSGNKDIDKYSPQLKRHHQILWAKPLPSGEIFDLRPMSDRYLVFRPDNHAFALSSDQISNSLRTMVRMRHITSRISDSELDNFQYLGATLGGTMLFPGKQINRKVTLNAARGLSKEIEDRFDLTLECIRLQYLNLPNPLQRTLELYWKFFELFRTFEQYVDFFLLQDLVTHGEVRFFLPSEEFTKPALPKDVDEYREYMTKTTTFLMARNDRIREWANSEGLLPGS
jgi:hypothetical protein